MSVISWLKDRLFCDLAIDLGTANTLVFLKGKGIIVQEPSIVVVNKSTGKVEAVGSRAKEMLGKTPTSVVAIKPMRDGVIADFEIAEKMLDYFIKKAMNNRGFLLRPRIVIGIPTGITQVERRAVKDVAMRAKASEVYLIEQPMSAQTCPSPSRRGTWSSTSAAGRRTSPSSPSTGSCSTIRSASRATRWTSRSSSS
jgi:rod shape-determining protein MreB